MISGFSTMQGVGNITHAFSGASTLPVPFNIPKVLVALLDENSSLEFTRQQKDLVEALRFAHYSREKMLQKLLIEENEVKIEMIEGDENAIKRLDDIKMQKLQGFEHYLELIEAMASLLESKQYQQLLESVGINPS